MLRRYSSELQQIADALQHADGAYLQTVFAQAKQARDAYTQTSEATADAQNSRSDIE
jgi:hypothetical protein